MYTQACIIREIGIDLGTQNLCKYVKKLFYLPLFTKIVGTEYEIWLSKSLYVYVGAQKVKKCELLWLDFDQWAF